MAVAHRGDVITLEINDKEAKVLSIILCSVGGPTSGMRGNANDVLGALEQIGYGEPNVVCHTGDFFFKAGY